MAAEPRTGTVCLLINYFDHKVLNYFKKTFLRTYSNDYTKSDKYRFFIKVGAANVLLKSGRWKPWHRHRH